MKKLLGVVLGFLAGLLLVVGMVSVGLAGYHLYKVLSRPPAPTGLVVGSADCSQIKSCV